MFNNFSINKHKYLKYSKSGSMHQLREIIELSRKPLDRNFAEKYNNISQVFENIFNKRQLQFPKQLIQNLISESKPIIVSIKKYHDRERPHVGAKRFSINLQYHKMHSAQTPSFPSGHSAQAQLIANVLSDEYPKHSSEFYQAAQNISDSRLVARVHYKSDSDAGLKLGNDLYEHYKMLKN